MSEILKLFTSKSLSLLSVSFKAGDKWLQFFEPQGLLHSGIGLLFLIKCEKNSH